MRVEYWAGKDPRRMLSDMFRNLRDVTVDSCQGRVPAHSRSRDKCTDYMCYRT